MLVAVNDTYVVALVRFAILCAQLLISGNQHAIILSGASLRV